MAYPTKIGTCCYCGTRAALVLSGKVRHELACSTCGAPLHALKMLRLERPDAPASAPAVRAAHQPAKPTTPVRKKIKKKKPRWGALFEDAFDIIEDIFD